MPGERTKYNLLRVYQSAYQRTFGEPAPLPYGATEADQCIRANSLVHNLKRWCGTETAAQYLDYFVTRWPELRLRLSAHGSPTLNIICTKSIFEKVRRWMIIGMPKLRQKDVDGVANRADADRIAEAKPEGW
jgi:hypothetical protein